MKSMLTAFAFSCLVLAGGAESCLAPASRLDCPRLMKAEWNSAERGAAQADCEFYNASIARGGDAWGDFAAPNASLPRGRGKDEIRAAYKRTYADPSFRLSWHPERAAQFGSSYVVTSGPYELHLERAGKDQLGRGTYITVWHRQADGSWLFVWDGGEEAAEQK